MMDGKGLVGGEDMYSTSTRRMRWQLCGHADKLILCPQKNSFLATSDATEEANPVSLLPSQEWYRIPFFFIL